MLCAHAIYSKLTPCVQVLDATPQEESPQGGGYRLGPSPRQAIKLGRRTNYDVEFVISEVRGQQATCVVSTHNSSLESLSDLI